MAIEVKNHNGEVLNNMLKNTVNLLVKDDTDLSTYKQKVDNSISNLQTNLSTLKSSITNIINKLNDDTIFITRDDLLRYINKLDAIEQQLKKPVVEVPHFGVTRYSFVYDAYTLVDIEVVPDFTLKPVEDAAMIGVRNAYNNYDLDLTLNKPAFIMRNGYYGGTFATGVPTLMAYIPCKEIISIKSYYMGNQYVSDFDYVRQTVNPTDILATDTNNSKHNIKQLTDGMICCVGFVKSNYSSISYNYKDEAFATHTQSTDRDFSSKFFDYNNSNPTVSSYYWALALMTGLQE